MASKTSETARAKGKAPLEEAPAQTGGLDRFFALTEAGSSVSTELRAGLATFLTMAYIMFVNPAILEKAGMDHGAVFVATCLAAAAGSAIMGLYANYPIALAPGMGLNAYFAFTVVPELGGNWQLALALVFASGVLFFALSLSPLRAWLIDAIPMSLKLGIAAGIGFFLALIGLQNAGIVADQPVTLVTLGDLSKPQASLAAAGFLVIAALAVRKVPGAIIIGVLAVTIAAAALGLEPWRGIAASPPSLAPTFLKLDLAGLAHLSLVTIVLTLLLVTILDTTGTLIGVARQAGLLDEEGRLPRLRQALLADSGSAMLGALFGTSTTTAYIESAAGVEEGGRTGLAAVAVAVLFLLSLFLAPLAESVPAYATAPALLFVAFLMAASLGALRFDDPTDYIPALLIALLMPLTYSIATGIGLGFIAYVALKGLTGRLRDINAAVAVIALAFLLKLAFA
ncbi:NCS2 family permease [Methyloceanibacter sp.]|uniref:NCS2 family permease n=1 Tax=Methyloceanibacter sp. TaxID=1965321 RepID=UPI002D2E7BA2|nr:NCS2 family permease [Methyloceanibacter sp.]HZP08857.1 NCS2 family permease [Methyloceanibacter sp.]